MHFRTRWVMVSSMQPNRPAQSAQQRAAEAVRHWRERYPWLADAWIMDRVTNRPYQDDAVAYLRRVALDQMLRVDDRRRAWIQRIAPNTLAYGDLVTEPGQGDLMNIDRDRAAKALLRWVGANHSPTHTEALDFLLVHDARRGHGPPLLCWTPPGDDRVRLPHGGSHSLPGYTPHTKLGRAQEVGRALRGGLTRNRATITGAELRVRSRGQGVSISVGLEWNGERHYTGGPVLSWASGSGVVQHPPLEKWVSGLLYVFGVSTLDDLKGKPCMVDHDYMRAHRIGVGDRWFDIDKLTTNEGDTMPTSKRVQGYVHVLSGLLSIEFPRFWEITQTHAHVQATVECKGKDPVHHRMLVDDLECGVMAPAALAARTLKTLRALLRTDEEREREARLEEIVGHVQLFVAASGIQLPPTVDAIRDVLRDLVK